MAAFSRLGTFLLYPGKRSVSVIRLANNGFRYNGIVDSVRCDQCQATFCNWKEGLRGAYDAHASWCSMSCQNGEVCGSSFSPTSDHSAGQQAQLLQDILNIEKPHVLESVMKNNTGWFFADEKAKGCEDSVVSGSGQQSNRKMIKETKKAEIGTGIQEENDYLQSGQENDKRSSFILQEVQKRHLSAVHLSSTRKDAVESPMTSRFSTNTTPHSKTFFNTGREETKFLSLSWLLRFRTTNLPSQPLFVWPITDDQSQSATGDNVTNDISLLMRSVRLRYASFVDATLRPDQWPTKLAHDGYYYDTESDSIKCFYCRAGPNMHCDYCNRQCCSVDFETSEFPLIDRKDILQIMGVKPKTPNQHDRRLNLRTGQEGERNPVAPGVEQAHEFSSSTSGLEPIHELNSSISGTGQARQFSFAVSETRQPHELNSAFSGTEQSLELSSAEAGPGQIREHTAAEVSERRQEHRERNSPDQEQGQQHAEDNPEALEQAQGQEDSSAVSRPERQMYNSAETRRRQRTNEQSRPEGQDSLRPLRSSDQTCDALAEAGFFRVSDDTMECFTCGLRLSLEELMVPPGTEEDQHLLTKHSQLSANCAFVRQGLAARFPPSP